MLKRLRESTPRPQHLPLETPAALPSREVLEVARTLSCGGILMPQPEQAIVQEKPVFMPGGGIVQLERVPQSTARPRVMDKTGGDEEAVARSLLQLCSGREGRLQALLESEWIRSLN